MNPVAFRWRLVFRVLMFLIGCAALLLATAALASGQHRSVQMLVTGSIASAGTLALSVLFVRWDGLRLRDVGAMPDRSSLGRFVVGCAGGLFLVTLHSIVVGVVGHTHWIRVGSPPAARAILIGIGFLFLAAREELAFHGYPLRKLHGAFGVWGAQVTVAAAFALEHVAGGWPLAQAMWGAGVGSLLFGMASIATRGLAIPIGMHAAWNFGDWLRGNGAEPGMWHAGIDSGFENAAAAAGRWAYLAIMGVAILCFWLWHRAREAACPARKAGQ